MKKKALLFGLAATCALLTFVKNYAKAETLPLSHYCEVIKTSPGNVSVSCVGSAAACNGNSDCLSN